MDLSGLEPLGAGQGNDEVDADHERHEKTENGFRHDGSAPVQQVRIAKHQAEEPDTGSAEDQIRHDRPFG